MTDSLETVVAIARYNADYQERERRRKELEKVQYGHDFGYNRQCRCGLYEKDYYMHRESRKLCPVAVGKKIAEACL